MKALRLGLAVLLLAFLSAPVWAAEQVKYRLLLQVSEDNVDRMMTALNIAKHVQNEFKAPNVNVEIVVLGGGIQTLKYYAPIPIADRVREAKYNGVRIVVCDYSMKAAKLKPSQMLQDVSYVPSGVVEIMEKASEGWIYVRP